MQPCDGVRLRRVIRLIVRTVIALAGNAIGLIVASLVFSGLAVFILPYLGLKKYLENNPR